MTETLSITSGYSVPCARKSNDPSLLRLLLEHVDERGADDLALLLGIGDAGEALEEERRGVRKHQRQLEPLEPRADLRAPRPCA